MTEFKHRKFTRKEYWIDIACMGIGILIVIVALAVREWANEHMPPEIEPTCPANTECPYPNIQGD